MGFMRSAAKLQINIQIGDIFLKANVMLGRIREQQQQDWAESHYSEGLKQLRKGQNIAALQQLTLAKSFRTKNINVLIAKGCAHANMNNLTEGLKQIKQALSMDAGNKDALRYYEQIKAQLREGQGKARKGRLSNDYEFVHK